MAYTARKILARGTAVLLIAAALPGCLPLTAPTIIGLAVDGVSYMATGKTVADHALSGLAQQDCSVGRAVFTGTDICYEEQDQPIIALQEEQDQPIIALQDVPMDTSIALSPASGPDADLPGLRVLTF